MKTVSKKLLSILLVAILLVSALPFQAFADVHDENFHTLGFWIPDTDTHYQQCTVADCDDAAKRFNETAHTFISENGKCVCKICGKEFEHVTAVVDKVDPTCTQPGYTGDTRCTKCDALIAKGKSVEPTGTHTYGENNVCTVCGTTKVGADAIMTLNPNGGTINGAATMTVNVNVGSPISILPDAYREGYNFGGWYTAGGEKVTIGANYKEDYATLIAKWTEKTYHLTVRRVLNDDFDNAKDILSVEVQAGVPLLDFLNTNVKSVIQQELNYTPGFSWESNLWYDFSGNKLTITQMDCMNQEQKVLVKFRSNPYNLYFNANGGTVNPVSKKVYFGSPVGVLPTPYLSGKVFQGWKDVNGNIYNANTVYSIAGDTSLTAVWQDEALVILYVYINGDFSSCNRMIVMDGFVKDKNISRSDVLAQVSKYYAPASGYLNIAGLFDEYSWSAYRTNTSKAGVENIQINSSHPNKIYVMVTNAKTGATVVNGTTSNPNAGTPASSNPVGAYWVSNGYGTGYWVYPAPANTNIPSYIYVGTNPKTGDTAMIELAAAMMVLAAGALVTLMTLRKKKMI